jgi:hypothetical protein
MDGGVDDLEEGIADQEDGVLLLLWISSFLFWVDLRRL